MAQNAQPSPSEQPQTVPDGPFAGWLTWGAGGDPFETAIGPFYFKPEPARVRCAFVPRREHLNGSGAIHGGALMSFADFALFALAHEALDGRAVTLSFASEFLAGGDLDGWVEAEGEVLRAGRSIVFVRGLIRQRGRALLAFSGALKKMRSNS